jgi:hypothetical protein
MIVGLFESLDELLAVLHTFDVAGDDLRLRVLGGVVEEVTLVKVGCVPVAHRLARVHSPKRDGSAVLAGVRARLRDERNRPRLGGHLRHERKTGFRAIQAHAVGPEHADAQFPRAARNLAL